MYGPTSFLVNRLNPPFITSCTRILEHLIKYIIPWTVSLHPFALLFLFPSLRSPFPTHTLDASFPSPRRSSIALSLSLYLTNLYSQSKCDSSYNPLRVYSLRISLLLISLLNSSSPPPLIKRHQFVFRNFFFTKNSS